MHVHTKVAWCACAGCPFQEWRTRFEQGSQRHAEHAARAGHLIATVRMQGAMLGGSAFSQLGALIDNPASLPNLLGTALPASSNFFINYIIIQARCP